MSVVNGLLTTLLGPIPASARAIPRRRGFPPDGSPWLTIVPRRGRAVAARHAGADERILLPSRERCHVEIVDQLVEEAVPVDFGLQMHEDRAEAYRGTIHEDEFARRLDATQVADVA